MSGYMKCAERNKFRYKKTTRFYIQQNRVADNEMDLFVKNGFADVDVVQVSTANRVDFCGVDIQPL